MKGTTIVVTPTGPDAVPRAITKITPMSDGFSVMVPYHVAKTCYLMKSPVDYSRRNGTVSLDDCVTCEATSRVKLSVHFPGFAQFSGEDNRRITSGRDPKTGEPRGLGVANDRPFDIRSGPVAGIGLWGLDDFKRAKSGKAQINLQVAKSLRREVPVASTVEVLLEIWMLSAEKRVFIADYLGQKMIRMVLPQQSGIEFPQDLYVIDLPGQSHFLGIQLVRYIGRPRDEDGEEGVPPGSSGFNLNGPAAMNEYGQYWGLHAWFPRPAEFPEARSLDRIPT